jgi:lipase chaperone LimK
MPRQRFTLYVAMAIAMVGSLALFVSCSTVAEPTVATGGTAPSQLGTTADGRLAAKGDALVIDDALRRRFDYYLAAGDEQPLSQILAKADADLGATLPEAAASSAKRLLRKYIDYRQAISGLKQNASLQGQSLSAARARLKAIRALRPQFFDQHEATGLFAWQDAYDDDALARMEIDQDHSLSDAVRRQRLAQLDAHAAPEILSARQAPVMFLALDKQVRDARAKGASDDEIFRIRAATVGDDAATRLAAVDREEHAWQQRIAAYKLDTAAIMGDPSLDDAGRQAAIQALRDARFSTLEQKRLRAFE